MKIHIIIAPKCFGIRPSQSLAKVTLLLKHSAKLLSKKKTRLSITDMLPHLHTIYNDVIVLNVSTEV